MLLPESSATYSAKKPYSAAFRLLQIGSKLLPEGSATYSAKKALFCRLPIIAQSILEGTFTACSYIFRL